MTAFKPRPVRAEDAVRIAMVATAGNLPTTTAPVPAGRKAPAVVQINFKATEAFAALLAELAEPDGGLRRYLARVLAAAGHPVPDADLNPPTGRRRRP